MPWNFSFLARIFTNGAEFDLRGRVIMFSHNTRLHGRIVRGLGGLRSISQAEPAPGSPFHLALPVHSMEEGE